MNDGKVRVKVDSDTNKCFAKKVSMKQSEREGSSRRNLYSMAVRNADEESWRPVVYHDENVSKRGLKLCSFPNKIALLWFNAQSPEAEAEYNRLYSTESVELQSDMTQSDFLDQISGIKLWKQ